MRTSLAELQAKLGPPISRGIHVQFGTDEHRVRYAFMTWVCSDLTREAGSTEAASGCRSACIAQNVVPSESEVFPEDNWILDPCDIHEKYFE
jgi:hypothetical protein